MAYTKHTWVDRQGIGLNKFTDQNGNEYEFTPNPDSITQTGTPFSAAWMNNIENGLADHINKMNTRLVNVSGIAPGTTLIGDYSSLSNYNVFYVEIGTGRPLGILYRKPTSSGIDGALIQMAAAWFRSVIVDIDFTDTSLTVGNTSGTYMEVALPAGTITRAQFSTLDLTIYGIA